MGATQAFCWSCLLVSSSALVVAPRRRASAVRVRMTTEVVQFTRDLRVSDHGGLLSVADPARGVSGWVAVYCGTDLGEAPVVRALGELDAALQERYGARLAVVEGRAEDVLPRLCRAVGATAVHVCGDEPTTEPSRAATAAALAAAGVATEAWSAPLRATGDDVIYDFGDYVRRLDGWETLAAEPAPTTLPPAVEVAGVDVVDISKSEDASTSSTAPWFDAVSAPLSGCASAGAALDDYLRVGRAAFADARFGAADALRGDAPESLYAASLRWVVGGAPPSDRLALREPAERAFSVALGLGCLSLREVACAATRAGAMPLRRTKGKGWPTFFFRSETALLDVAEWKEFHRLVAQTLEGDRARGVTWFRWEGHLARYLTLRDDEGDREGPALVLVHGFGASADQWRRLEAALPAASDGGPATVLAVDILGFGLSAKPGLSYTQHLWEAYLADFVSRAVPGDRRVVVAGNSIGGGLCSGLAANLDDKICGLVLCNSAGVILGDGDDVRDLGDMKRKTLALDLPAYGGPPQVALDAFGEAVIKGLWPRIPDLLVKYYDTNPANADAALVAAISRDALDPGAANVIGSGAKLPPQRSLNEAFADYEGPILVPQGAYDGVTGPDLAQKRARDLQNLRAGIDVTLLDSGHCPHDETPDLVADALATWWPKAAANAPAP